MKKKTYNIVLIFLIVISACLAWVKFFETKQQLNTITTPASVVSQKQVSTTTTAMEEKVVKLGFVGDMMFDRSVKKSIEKNGAGNFTFSFDSILPTLKTFDWLFGNLEGPVSEKKEKVCGSMYSFVMDLKVLPVLKDVGFKAVSIANNHMFDYCQEAFLDTLKNLTDNNIAFVGGGSNEDTAYSAKITKIGSLNLGLLGYTEFGGKYITAKGQKPGLAIINLEKMCQSISEAKKLSDIIVVSFHFGTEYSKIPNKYQRETAERAIDCGADLVVGHHPHVVEPLEYYKNKPIVYSLGNFIFDQSFSAETMSGNILSVTIKNKEISQVELIPYKLNKYFQPEIVN